MKVNWIEGRGYDSNIYLIQGEVNLLIDTGTGRNFDRVRGELEELGTGPRGIDIIINTHHHFDHVGGNSDFLQACDCELMASEESANVLRAADREETFAGAFGGELEPMEVSRALSEGDEIEVGEGVLTVLSTPGHTPGDISLYEPEEKVLFSGDTVFRGGIGRTDLPSSDRGAMRSSLQKLAGLDVERLYPGHGPTAEEDGHRYIKQGLDLLGRW